MSTTDIIEVSTITLNNKLFLSRDDIEEFGGSEETETRKRIDFLIREFKKLRKS